MFARQCSAALTVQLQGGCGLPVASDGGTLVSFSSTSGSLGFFGDGQCIGSPSQHVIPSGSSTLDVFFRDTAQGTPTMMVSSAGLDSGTQQATINCLGGEKPCGANCIPQANCCQDADCNDGGVTYVCNSGTCAPPPCVGFVNNCSTFVDATASGANRTVTFGSSGYSPDCIRIGSSQSVTFSGSFFLHPLRQTCGPTDLNMFTNSGSTKSFDPPGFGTWGYECAAHPVFENGAIRVP